LIKKYPESLANTPVILNQLTLILKILPNNEEFYKPKFIERQKEINYFTSILFNIQMDNIINNEIMAKAWKSLHSFAIKQLLLKVQEAKSISSLNISSDLFEWLNQFYSFILKEKNILQKINQDPHCFIISGKGGRRYICIHRIWSSLTYSKIHIICLSMDRSKPFCIWFTQ
jgi:hypothetical protein